MRGRKRVGIHVVRCQHSADVGLEREISRLPQHRQKSYSCGESDRRKHSCRNSEGAFAHAHMAITPLAARDTIGQKDKQRQIRRKRVVLLIGGDRKKDEDDSREYPAHQPGARCKVSSEFRSSCVGNAANGRWKIQTPRKQPDQVQRPIQCPGKLVVIPWIALPQKPQKMFVDEIEPEKSVSTLAPSVAQPCQNVPGRGNGEKQGQAENQPELTPAPPLSCDAEI